MEARYQLRQSPAVSCDSGSLADEWHRRKIGWGTSVAAAEGALVGGWTRLQSPSSRLPIPPQRALQSVESSRVVYDEFLVTRGGDVNAVIG